MGRVPSLRSATTPVSRSAASIMLLGPDELDDWLARRRRQAR